MTFIELSIELVIVAAVEQDAEEKKGGNGGGEDGCDERDVHWYCSF